MAILTRYILSSRKLLGGFILAAILILVGTGLPELMFRMDRSGDIVYAPVASLQARSNKRRKATSRKKGAGDKNAKRTAVRKGKVDNNAKDKTKEKTKQTKQTAQQKLDHRKNMAYHREFKKLRRQIALMKLHRSKLSLERQLAEEILRKRLRQLRAQTLILNLKNKKRNAVNQQNVYKLREEKQRISIALSRMRMRMAKLDARRKKSALRLSMLKLRIQRRKQVHIWDAEVNRPQYYTMRPYNGKRLRISDRRISLNGPIHYIMADVIAKKLQYFNNISTIKPIFLVIDASPGGSVMAGYRILRAMQASRAPIHVVVKTYAASMAAVILTRATYSYAHPNAIILHHQVSSSARGNLRQQQERLAITKEWMRRLMTPVAKKMGISLDKMVSRMYEKNSDGDWREFASEAKKLKWVRYVVSDIREEGIRRPVVKKRRKRFVVRRRHQSGASGSGAGSVVSANARADAYETNEDDGFAPLPEIVDETGRRRVILPRTLPYDVYFMHNPDGYYRLP